MTLRISIAAAWACLGLWTSLAMAQARSTSSGATSAGVNQLTPTQATNLATGTSGGAGGASSAGGAAGRAGGAGGQTQMGADTQSQFNAGDGSVGAQIGQSGFAGRSTTGFAGNRNAGQNTGQSLTPQFNQVDDGSAPRNQGTTGRANKKRARPQQRIAFTFPKANLAAAQVELGQRFKKISQVAGVDTAISDEGVATLTGMVASDDSRKLAEALTRLEPGVRSVVNELKINSVSP